MNESDQRMVTSININSRFHGPASSGNGGYSCGLIGKHFDTPAAVRLRVPPPLETPMDLRQTADGMALFHGDIVVATARPAVVDIDIPAPPGFEAAVAASRRYRGLTSHFYPGCFVCGPERKAGDGLRIFAGPVETGSGPEGMVAATWVPDDSLADSSGNVAPEFVWAALDCPGAYSFPEPAEGAILLGELAVSVKEPVSPGRKYVLIGWEISHEGRKHYTGTAIFGDSGRCHAVAYATWFEVPTGAI